jgi:hypothetical protein
MNQQVTREILSNVPPAFRIFFYAMLIPLTAAYVYEGMHWYRMVSLGQPVDRSDRPQRRLWLVLRDTAGGQRDSRDLGLYPLRLLRRISRPLHRHDALFFNDQIEAAGYFGFPCYLVGMMEVL